MASEPSDETNPSTSLAQPARRRVPPRAVPEDGELLDAFTACKFLGMSTSTLRKLVASGKLQGQVLGARNQRFYKRIGLEAYLAEYRPNRHGPQF